MVTNSEFGAFFRQTREGLGLSLREFCRRTGFDQGNVSRLERGLLPPPKSEKVLTAYAKGLKLKPKSAGWEQFMTLAKPPEKARRGSGHKNWVKAKNLEDWAGRLDARSILPQLIRRLIRATGAGIIRLEAPAGEQTQRPGWDVLVEASVETEFVPQGVSAWEMGVDKDIKKKAEEDWAKRLKKAPGVNKRKSTFVFVTPRKWQKKRDWVEEKTKLKSWKEVRVYDSESLEEWLECAPRVDIWLARQLGLCPDGVIDVDEYWKNLQALTDLSTEVYLTSRREQLPELKQWLTGPPDTLSIENPSPGEALDFVVAASRESELREEFAARALIVETREAWRSLAGSDGRLILIVHPELAIEAELVAEAVRNGHHVIECVSGMPMSQHKRIVLRRVSSLDLQKALEEQGVERRTAEKLATTVGGSITVLKRRLGRHPGTVHPEWSRAPHVRAVVPFLLAGRWNDTAEGDRRALEKLADVPYREVATRAEQWSGSADPMLIHALSCWELVSRDDSWDLIANAINDADLRQFEEVALEVLGEADPARELPRDVHSDTLRKGVAETLALLGARPPRHTGLTLNPEDLTKHVVRSLLHGKDWKAWASLSSELPLLAEAAPDTFLTALENDLSKKSPAVLKLFEPNASSLFGPNRQIGSLFAALEGLTWDTKRFSQVSLLLARLYETAPNTKFGNPLEQVFMPWYPQTTASIENRVRVVEMIAKKYSKAGWRLLLGLLPQPHSIVSPNRRPEFQNWALQWSEGTTQADYTFQVEAFSHLVVELAGKDSGRLKNAIEVFENLLPTARKNLLERLLSIDPTALRMEERRVLVEAIRTKVDRHRRFATAGWALAEPILENLDRVRQFLEPEDVVLKNAWLFGDYWKVWERIWQRDGGEKDPDQVLNCLRATALEEVRSEKDWDGVLALAQAAASPDQVGLTVGVSEQGRDDSRVLPTLLTDSQHALVMFAKGFVRGRQQSQGWDWVKKLALGEWSDVQILEFVLALPSEPKAWDIVSTRGLNAEEQYWKRPPQFCFNNVPADVSLASRKLADVGRVTDAVRQLAMAIHRNVEINPAVIAQVLEQCYPTLINPEEQKWLDQGQYDVKVLIERLQKLVEAGDAHVEENQVASLEWKYLEILDGHTATPKILYRRLDTKPGFFVELLSIVFSPSGDQEGQRPKPSESERARALQAFRLLNSWQRVPGSRLDGSINEGILRGWVRSAQTAVAENERLRHHVDTMIGNVFASDKTCEPDGTWPRIPVRDAIEEFGTEAMAEGFGMGVINSQGAYWKAPDEGGNRERTLANQYFRWATASEIEWPKTAGILRRVGEQYEADARRADAEGEFR
jgi:transcriptional regulator with XRE-family HTH domain